MGLKPQWISVKDQLPSDMKDVLFCYILRNEISKEIVRKDIVTGHLGNGIWHICYLFHSIPLKETVEVTHWTELPEKPNG
jgi:Protein of unknown function (DUF551).